jgi:hypothetical protein
MSDSPATPAPTRGYRVPLARTCPDGSSRYGRIPQADVPARRSSNWDLLGIVLILVALLVFGYGEWISGKHTGMGIIIAPILTIASMALLNRSVRAERSFDLRGLLLTSIGLRLLFSYPRFLNAADAVAYNQYGARLALNFRKLEFVHVDVGPAAPVPGTGSLRYLAGLGHLFTGSNFFGTTMLFTFLGFWGSWFLYRAFVVGLPDGDRRRYARFVMLWPSVLYWPASIGKDSWMLVTIALAALGAAKILTRGRGGWILVLIGLAGAALVRPHVSLLVFVAILVAFLVGRRNTRAMPGTISLSGITKALGIVVLLVGGALLAPAAAHFLKVDDLSTTSVTNALVHTQAQTAEGNSAFHAVNPNSPIGYPVAAFTVLFRPLPGEVQTAAGLLASAEAAALLLLVIVGWRRLLGAFHRLRSEAYATFALAYIAMFAYAFSAIANFGILARERVQVLPFLFVLLSLPKWHRRRPDEDTAAISSRTKGIDRLAHQRRS